MRTTAVAGAVRWMLLLLMVFMVAVPGAASAQWPEAVSYEWRPARCPADMYPRPEATIIRANTEPRGPNDPWPAGNTMIFQIPVWTTTNRPDGTPYPGSTYRTLLTPIGGQTTRVAHPTIPGVRAQYDWVDNPTTKGNCWHKKEMVGGDEITEIRHDYQAGGPQVTGRAYFMGLDGEEEEPEEPPPPCEEEEHSRRPGVAPAGDPPPPPDCCPVEQNSREPRVMPAGDPGGGGEDPCDPSPHDECDGTLYDEDCDWQVCITIDWYWNGVYVYTTEDCFPLE